MNGPARRRPEKRCNEIRFTRRYQFAGLLCRSCLGFPTSSLDYKLPVDVGVFGDAGGSGAELGQYLDAYGRTHIGDAGLVSLNSNGAHHRVD